MNITKIKQKKVKKSKKQISRKLNRKCTKSNKKYSKKSNKINRKIKKNKGGTPNTLNTDTIDIEITIIDVKIINNKIKNITTEVIEKLRLGMTNNEIVDLIRVKYLENKNNCIYSILGDTRIFSDFIDYDKSERQFLDRINSRENLDKELQVTIMPHFNKEELIIYMAEITTPLNSPTKIVSTSPTGIYSIYIYYNFKYSNFEKKIERDEEEKKEILNGVFTVENDPHYYIIDHYTIYYNKIKLKKFCSILQRLDKRFKEIKEIDNILEFILRNLEFFPEEKEALFYTENEPNNLFLSIIYVLFGDITFESEDNGTERVKNEKGFNTDMYDKLDDTIKEVYDEYRTETEDT
jgi:hypothetical protein